MSAQARVATQLAVLALTVGVAGSAMAAACKDVTFKFTNSHWSGATIRLSSVDYWDNTAGRLLSENVADVVCSYGSTCSTSGTDALGGIAAPVLGHNITQILYKYKYDGGGSWITGVDVWHLPAVPLCTNGRTYGAFTILG